jgi:hypothetical protein
VLCGGNAGMYYNDTFNGDSRGVLVELDGKSWSVKRVVKI